MRLNRTLILLGSLVGGLTGAPFAAHADVSMKLTGVEGPIMGGVYTSPYMAKIGGSDTSTAIFCDDFETHVSLGESWNATVTNMSALHGITSPLLTLKFDTNDASTQQHDYMAAAWLAEQIADTVAQKQTGWQNTSGALSFALWGVFDPGSLSHLTGTNLTNASTYLADARNHVSNLDPDDFSNVNIYTADPKWASQEYLTVPPVPEPGTLALFAAGVVALGLMRRSRRALNTDAA